MVYFQLTLKQFVYLRRLIGLIWRHQQSRVSLSRFRARSSTESKFIAFSICNTLCSHKPVTSQSTAKRGYKIHLSFHFSVRTHSSTLQQKLGTTPNFQDPYLIATSNVNLLPTQSPSIKILLKRNSSLRAQIGLLTVGNRGITHTL